jgi:NADH-quinone oxidoreductase subunit F
MEATKSGLKDTAELSCEPTGCLGLCQRGQLVTTEPDGYVYEKVSVEDAYEIVDQTLLAGLPVSRLCQDPSDPKAKNHPFYLPQKRLIMRRFGRINPERFDDYLRTGGYQALALAVRLGPEEVAFRIEASGLRGRGGSGFPAGRKWKACRTAEGDQKYVLANGDEGDPGAFMNRSLMEGDPLAIIEGLTLGAYAVGANQGYIYVRHEYPLSVARLRLSISNAEQCGLLGDNILGSGFSFKLSVVEGGGAFVCGESTALMASIEGREGQPRVKYVRSTERGLWDKPTLLQNVETWANVPLIVENGPQWFKSLGSESNPGTKIFSLVGQVRRSGLAELPLGTKIRTVVEEVGGGHLPGRFIKAVQTGGPSGGCLPVSELDLPLDFDRLPAAGTIMGSGGLIVIDDLSCMVDVARYFTKFLMTESCGKCLPCREGLAVIDGLLNDLCQSKAQIGDTDKLKELALTLSETALCGLGQSAANPVISTIRYFHHEYIEHEQGYCRSGRCQGMFIVNIDSDLCSGCGACQTACPSGAIIGRERKVRQVNTSKCISCGACLATCHFGALKTARRANHE